MYINAVALQRYPGLVLVLDTPKGRGLFASQFIPAGTILDTSPVLLLPPDCQHGGTSKHKVNSDCESAPIVNGHIQESDECNRCQILIQYTFNWPTKPPQQALPLGYGSLFNHSRRRQNVGWSRDLDRQTITYRTLRDVREGEELSLNYGASYDFGGELVDSDSESDGSDSQEDHVEQLLSISL